MKRFLKAHKGTLLVAAFAAVSLSAAFGTFAASQKIVCGQESLYAADESPAVKFYETRDKHCNGKKHYARGDKSWNYIRAQNNGGLNFCINKKTHLRLAILPYHGCGEDEGYNGYVYDRLKK